MLLVNHYISSLKGPLMTAKGEVFHMAANMKFGVLMRGQQHVESKVKTVNYGTKSGDESAFQTESSVHDPAAPLGLEGPLESGVPQESSSSTKPVGHSGSAESSNFPESGTSQTDDTSSDSNNSLEIPSTPFSQTEAQETTQPTINAILEECPTFTPIVLTDTAELDKTLISTKISTFKECCSGIAATACKYKYQFEN